MKDLETRLTIHFPELLRAPRERAFQIFEELHLTNSNRFALITKLHKYIDKFPIGKQDFFSFGPFTRYVLIGS